MKYHYIHFPQVVIINKAKRLLFKTHFCVGVFVKTTFGENDASKQDMELRWLKLQSHVRSFVLKRKFGYNLIYVK